jgi:hypothetical protein
VIPSILQVLGLAAVTLGVTMLYIPAGVIVGGVSLILLGVAIERSK